MTFSPIQSAQPLNTFFSISLGSLQKIYTGVDADGDRNPNSPVDFELIMSDGGNTLIQITLFDADGFDIEPYIWQSAKSNPSGVAGGTLQWECLDNSFAITILAMPTLSMNFSCNQINGTVGQIFDRIEVLHGLTIKKSHEPGTQFMLERCQAANDTALCEMSHCKLAQETDMQYLRRIVEGYYIDQQGVAGFRVYAGSEDGQPVLFARPSDSPPSALLQYIVQDRNSPVISWNPCLNFDYPTWNSNDNFFMSHQKITGDTQIVPCQQQLTQSYQVSASSSNQSATSTPPTGKANQLVNVCAERMDSSVTGSAVRFRPSATHSPYAGVNPALCDHILTWQSQVTAELKIIGDPSILINVSQGGLQQVGVQFHYPQNYKNSTPSGLHYTSDNYYLTGVIHRIKSGEYTTTLNLERAGLTNLPTVNQN